jgi:hypothetical protein
MLYSQRKSTGVDADIGDCATAACEAEQAPSTPKDTQINRA